MHYSTGAFHLRSCCSCPLSLDLPPLSSLVFSLSNRGTILTVFVILTVVGSLKVLSFLFFQVPLEKPSGETPGQFFLLVMCFLSTVINDEMLRGYPAALLIWSAPAAKLLRWTFCQTASSLFRLFSLSPSYTVLPHSVCNCHAFTPSYYCF